MVKTRMQIKSEASATKLSTFDVAKNLYSTEGGFKAFYKGYPLFFESQIELDQL